MIKNDRQYRITKAQADRFAAALAELEQSAETDAVHPLLRQAQLTALSSQYEELCAQMVAYEILRADRRKH